MSYPDDNPKQRELEAYLKRQIKISQQLALNTHPNNSQKANHCFSKTFKHLIENDPNCQILVKNTIDENIMKSSSPYQNPATDIVTTIGSSAGIYSNFPKVSHPVISKHYGDIYFKYGKTVGKIGVIGDVMSSIGVIVNLIEKPSSAENWVDAIFTITGYIPVYGDFTSFLYMGTKSQIKIRQNNIERGINPMRGVYAPATGDVWY